MQDINPSASIPELHLTFVLWEKLLGFNNALVDGLYDYRLWEYEDKCSNGLPVPDQLGRISGVRDVMDAKPYASEFRENLTDITYISAGLCRPSKKMQPFEDLFNEFSKELRKAIHIDKSINQKEIIKEQLDFVQLLNKAYKAYAVRGFNPISDPYKDLFLTERNSRVLNLEGYFYDNLALEQFVGLTITQLSNDKSYHNKFLKNIKLDLFGVNADKFDQVSDILCGINFESNSWKYNLDQVNKIITSSEEVANPLIAPHLIKSLKDNRQLIYSSSVIQVLNKEL